MNKRLPLFFTLSALTLAGCKPEASAPESAVPPSQTQTVSPGTRTKEAEFKDTQVTSRIRKIVAEQLKLPIDRVLLTSTWKQLGADSLDTVELIMAFEEEFHIEIPDERAEAMKTVGDAVIFLTQQGKP